MAKKILKEIELAEISAVTRPAQKPARMLLMKRDFKEDERKKAASSGDAMSDGSFPIVNRNDLKNAIHSIGRAKNEDAAKKHIVSRAKSLDSEDLLPDGWVSKSADDIRKGEQMDENIKKAVDEALAKSNTEWTVKYEKLEKASQAALVLAKASDAEKEHMKGMSDADCDKFMAMSADDRKTKMAKSAGDNPVVYKTADGIEFHKNDDPRYVAMAKRADENEKIAKAERDARQTVEFTKQAETDLAALPGAIEKKVSLLKSLSSVPAEHAETLFTMLKAGNEAMSAGFRKIGVTVNRDGSKADAATQLETLTKKHAEDNKMPFAKAQSEVLKTEEGKALYSKMEAEKGA